MSDIIIISQKISREKLKEIAEQRFGDLVKGVVDIEKGVVALGGEMHADEEAALLENGSDQKDLWGINIYPDKPQEEWLEFDSMINIRPGANNRSRFVEDLLTREKILKIISALTE
ncbi:MAG TPA: DUF5674 family protein [Candidatus Nanoarchaeia archaeon]|nr:DUF5674 family protein [Candidatus Nanoarchaeia archaeon]